VDKGSKRINESLLCLSGFIRRNNGTDERNNRNIGCANYVKVTIDFKSFNVNNNFPDDITVGGIIKPM